MENKIDTKMNNHHEIERRNRERKREKIKAPKRAFWSFYI